MTTDKPAVWTVTLEGVDVHWANLQKIETTLIEIYDCMVLKFSMERDGSDDVNHTKVTWKLGD